MILSFPVISPRRPLCETALFGNLEIKMFMAITAMKRGAQSALKETFRPLQFEVGG